MQVVAAGLDPRATCRTLYIRRFAIVSATLAVSARAHTHTHAQSALPVMSGADSLALRAVATVAKRASG